MPIDDPRGLASSLLSTLPFKYVRLKMLAYGAAKERVISVIDHVWRSGQRRTRTVQVLPPHLLPTVQRSTGFSTPATLNPCTAVVKELIKLSYWLSSVLAFASGVPLYGVPHVLVCELSCLH